MLISLAVCAAVYAAVVVLVWLQQDRLVFAGAGHGDRTVAAYGARTFPLTVALPGAPGGVLTVRAVECLPARPAAVLVHFVGNGETLSSAARRAEELAAYGVAVVSPEYPGYGLSPGQPGVESLLATADAAADYALRRAQELGVPFLVSGSSLGTFCAVHVAAAGKARRLLLRAPPTTMVEAAQARFWWLPVRLLLRHRFDSLSVAPQVSCPVLIVHGDRDDIVPLELGQRLRAAFAGPAELVVVPGAGHNDLSWNIHEPVGERCKAFLLGP